MRGVGRVAASASTGGPGGTARRRRVALRSVLAFVVAASVSLAAPAGAVVYPGSAPGSTRGGGETQIDESSPDAAATPSGPGGSGSLPERLREYVEGSVARYDALKSSSAGFRRQGWFPSFFLRDPQGDVLIEPGPAGASVVTVHLSCARRDLEQRLVIAPVERFELPGADKRFFTELLGALATAAPEIGRARVLFWFAVLRADGRMTWESRGSIGLTAAAARRFAPGLRTAEAVWPLLDENTLPAVWDGP